MDRLADYVQWMEDFPIEATGLRDADALVLCALSYFDLSPLFKGRRKTARIQKDCPFLLNAFQLPSVSLFVAPRPLRILFLSL